MKQLIADPNGELNSGAETMLELELMIGPLLDPGPLALRPQGPHGTLDC